MENLSPDNVFTLSIKPRPRLLASEVHTPQWASGIQRTPLGPRIPRVLATLAISSTHASHIPAGTFPVVCDGWRRYRRRRHSRHDLAQRRRRTASGAAPVLFLLQLHTMPWFTRIGLSIPIYMHLVVWFGFPYVESGIDSIIRLASTSHPRQC